MKTLTKTWKQRKPPVNVCSTPVATSNATSRVELDKVCTDGENISPITQFPNTQLFQDDEFIRSVDALEQQFEITKQERRARNDRANKVRRSQRIAEKMSQCEMHSDKNIELQKKDISRRPAGGVYQKESAASTDDPAGDGGGSGNSQPVVSQSSLLLSSWGLPQPVLDRYRDAGIECMFEWQVSCLLLEGVLSGGNLVYSAPTSAGKTLVAEILMLKCVLERKKKAIMILPFVSVTHEKVQYLKKIFRCVGVEVDGYMGSHAPLGGFSKVDIAVCTIEKANGLINRLIEEKTLNKLGMIVVDELHMVNDPHRGYLLELLLTKIKYIQKKSLDKIPSSLMLDMEYIQLIGMSATLPNLDLLARWLDAKLFCTDFRPVPLTECLMTGCEIQNVNTKEVIRKLTALPLPDDPDHVVQLCMETVIGGHSVLIFCPTKAWCEKLAETISRKIFILGKDNLDKNDNDDVNVWTQFRNGLRSSLDGDKLAQILSHLRKTSAGLDKILARTVSFGVAFHHAGLTFDEREIIEGAFRQGVIKVITATSTLSSGVNLPARRVIIRTPVFRGSLLDVLTYRQMIGRAGRKGLDSSGESILMCKASELEKAHCLATSKLVPVSSCLSGGSKEMYSSLKRAILEIVVSGIASGLEDVDFYVSCTLFACDNKNRSSIMQPIVDIQRYLNFLLESELIRHQNSGTTDDCAVYVGSSLGRAVLASSLSADEGLVVYQELERARRCFVLENELHVVYQVTPIYLTEQWQNMDWFHYLDLWEHLSPDMKRVGTCVGVDEGFLTMASRGSGLTNAKKLSVHLRFYTALALHDLVNEVPLNSVARKYDCSRGMLQSLQQSASTFAGMVTVFCHQLGWYNMELLLTHFQSRLHFGVQQELCDLVRLTSLNAQRARILYNAGYKTVALLAASSPAVIETALINAGPYESGKQKDNETKWELAKRLQHRHLFWLSGHKSITTIQAATLIIDEAREVVQTELGVAGAHWSNEESMRASAESVRSVPISNAKGDDGVSASFTDYVENVCLDDIATLKKRSSISHEPKENLDRSVIDAGQKNAINSTDSFVCLSESEFHISFNTNLTVEVPEDKQIDVRPTDGEEHCTQSDSLDLSGSEMDRSTPDVIFVDGEWISPPPREETLLANVIVGPKEKLRLDVGHSTPTSDASSNLRSDVAFSEDIQEFESLTASSKGSEANDSLRISCDSSDEEFMDDSVFNQSEAFKEHERNVNSNASLSEAPGAPIENTTYTEDLFGCSVQFNPRLDLPNHSVCIMNGASVTKTLLQEETVKPNQSEETKCAKKRSSVDSVDTVMAAKKLFSPPQQNEDSHENSIECIPPTPSPQSSTNCSSFGKEKVSSHKEATSKKMGREEYVEREVLSTQKKNGNSKPVKLEEPLSTVVSNRGRGVYPSGYKVVNLTDDPNTFLNFVDEWFSVSRFSFAFVVERKRATAENGRIGQKIVKGKNVCKETHGNVKLPSVQVYGEDVNVVGLTVCWNLDTVYVISLKSDGVGDKRPSVSVRDVSACLRKVFCTVSSEALVTVIAYDLKEHLRVLYEICGQLPQNVVFQDPRIAAWLLNPESIDACFSEHVKQFLPSHAPFDGFYKRAVGSPSLNVGGEPLTNDRAPTEAALTYQMMEVLLLQLKTQRMLKVFREIEMKCVLSLLKIELNGLGLDEQCLRSQQSLFETRILDLESKAEAIVGHKLNMASSLDTAQALYVDLRLPTVDILELDDSSLKPARISRRLTTCSSSSNILRQLRPRKSSAGPTNKSVLKKLNPCHELPKMIMEWRSLNSSLTKIIIPMLNYKVAHKTLNMHRVYSRCETHTATGRVVMNEPNLQMVPRDFQMECANGDGELQSADSNPLLDKTISLRSGFIPFKGGVFVAADYSQLELRILAHLSKDVHLLRVLNAGEDVFKSIAAQWKGRCSSTIMDHERQQAKQICYGMIYGMGPKALAEQLNVEEAEAVVFVESFKSKYPDIEQFVKLTLENCRRDGYVKTLMGRRRPLEAINSDNQQKRSHAERQAVNTTVQGSAADVAKKAMIDVDARMAREFPGTRCPLSSSSWIEAVEGRTAKPSAFSGGYFVLQLHDELLYETVEDDVVRVASIVKNGMENAVRLRVKLPVKIKVGKSWGKLEELTLGNHENDSRMHAMASGL